MSASRRYEILLPLRFNDGQPVPEEFLGEVLEGLEHAFQAVSWETQIIRGLWQKAGRSYRDELIRIFVDLPDVPENREFFLRFRERMKVKFGQLDNLADELLNRHFVSGTQRILVVAEHDSGQLKLATLSAVAFAAKVIAEIGGAYEILVLGEGVASLAQLLSHYAASAVLIADQAQLKNPLADKYAHIIAQVVKQREATLIVAAASTFSKDILPRSAALLDAGMLSDVIEARPDGDDFIFKRVMFAGNVIATVKLAGAVKFLTVRPAAFAHPAKASASSPMVSIPVEVEKLPALSEWAGREAKASGRPDSTEARVVVSGGRAIRNAEDFERLIGGLADALGGAIGSSRALVDAGITSNSLQVGQTGKIVAPDLYIAVGISGAIQHLAGIKDAKIIVAINKDPEAPIFEVADFGLTGDAYQIVPELMEKLRK